MRNHATINDQRRWIFFKYTKILTIKHRWIALCEFSDSANRRVSKRSCSVQEYDMQSDFFLINAQDNGNVAAPVEKDYSRIALVCKLNSVPASVKRRMDVGFTIEMPENTFTIDCLVTFGNYVLRCTRNIALPSEKHNRSRPPEIFGVPEGNPT